MSWDIEGFREKLESQHQFPGEYSFKFIVPFGKKEELLKFMPAGKTSFRPSSNNKYISITTKAHLGSSDEVLKIYTDANTIEGCIAL
ncbi:MAG: DUF493 family protein [Cyclobacteriaceae bacterium]